MKQIEKERGESNQYYLVMWIMYVIVAFRDHSLCIFERCRGRKVGNAYIYTRKKITDFAF